MGIPVTVIVPESTSLYMREKIQDFGAELEVYGSAWDDANEKGKTASFSPFSFIST
jgi:L-serine/L-threonine ammonia-lyase